jgi:glutamine synthetase
MISSERLKKRMSAWNNFMLNMAPVSLSFHWHRPIRDDGGSPGADTYFTGPHCTQTPFTCQFLPRPFANEAGNGAHLHYSFTREGQPLLAGGTGIYGITAEGGSLIAGIVRYLPELVALLAPSVLSAERLQPGHWSGAYACWGLENREAAVRYCAANRGNPYGAHLEVKCIDPAANPYIACGSAGWRWLV